MNRDLPVWMVSGLLGVWVVSVGLIVIGIVLVVRRLPLSPRSRMRRLSLSLSLGIFLGWFLLVFFLSKTGAFQFDRHSGLRVPLLLAMTGPTVLAYVALRLQAWREVVLAVPDYWLVAIQGFSTGGNTTVS